jgi:hypothetical protein
MHRIITPTIAVASVACSNASCFFFWESVAPSLGSAVPFFQFGGHLLRAVIGGALLIVLGALITGISGFWLAAI